jgi:hypothetical protein
MMQQMSHITKKNDRRSGEHPNPLQADHRAV